MQKGIQSFENEYHNKSWKIEVYDFEVHLKGPNFAPVRI